MPERREQAERKGSRPAKALTWIWLGLVLIGFLYRGKRVFPTDAYATFTFLASVALGLALYKVFLDSLKLEGRSDWEKALLVFGTPVVFPVLIWASLHKPIPILTDMFAVAPLDTVVVIAYKDTSIRGRPCRRSLKIREFGLLYQGKLCVDPETWEQARPGDRIRLVGRRHGFAWYVDAVWLK